MQKSSVKKLSILSLVLIAASAVTAAVIPNKETKESKKFVGGALQASTGGTGQTCAGSGSACNVTAASSTTGASGTSTSGIAASTSAANTTANS